MASQLHLSPDPVSRIRALLIQAGYPDYRYFVLYVGIRVLFAVVGFVSALLISGTKSPPLLIGVTALGFFIPRFILKGMIGGRQKRIRLGLIDFFDLTALCVGAGLFPLQAMKRVAKDLRHTYPELSAEVYLVCCEIQAGYSLDEALWSMSERTGVGEIEELSELIRAEPLGVVRVLQTCADFLRVERGQHAKAKTMVPALVVFGVVFTFPLVLVVTLGPAVIQLYRTLTI
jgi:tight adherence protein C